LPWPAIECRMPRKILGAHQRLPVRKCLIVSPKPVRRDLCESSRVSANQFAEEFRGAVVANARISQYRSVLFGDVLARLNPWLVNPEIVPSKRTNCVKKRA